MADVSGSEQKFTKKQKLGMTGVLSAVASIVTILSFLKACGGTSSTSGSSPGSAPAPAQAQAAYPVSVQQSFLGTCEESGSTVAQCQCGLTWFESNVTLARFQVDLAEYQEGGLPTDLVAARDACNS